MKSWKIAAAVCILAVSAGSVASAADIARHQTGAGFYDWSGLTLGLIGGAGFGKREIEPSYDTPEINQRGALVGAEIAYHKQFGRVVVGAAADLQKSWISGSSSYEICPAIYCGSSIVENDTSSLLWFGTVRGNLGYSFGNFLPYLTAGAAFGQTKQRYEVVGSWSNYWSEEKHMNAGYAVGGGFNVAIDTNWIIAVDALHLDFGESETKSLYGNSTVKNSYNVVRGKLFYRF